MASSRKREFEVIKIEEESAKRPKDASVIMSEDPVSRNSVEGVIVEGTSCYEYQNASGDAMNKSDSQIREDNEKTHTQDQNLSDSEPQHPNSSANVVSPWQCSSSSVLERLAYLLKHHDFSDCSVTVGQSQTQTYQVHKMMLCMSSSKFKDLLAENKDLNLPDIAPKIFDLLLLYIYQDSLEPSSVEDACDLYRAALTYDIPHLVKITREFLLKNLTLENLWDVYEIGVDSRDADLQSQCHTFLCKQSSAWQMDRFVSIRKEVLELILEQEHIDVSELEVLKAVDRWANYQCTQSHLTSSPGNKREVLGPKVISRIRFLALKPEDFVAFCCDSGTTQKSFLTTEETFAILANLNVFGSVQLPNGISQRTFPRGYQKFRLIRKPCFLFSFNPTNQSGTQAYALSCPTQNSSKGSKKFTLNLRVSEKIVIHGVQVPTLWYPTMCLDMNNSKYKETYSVVVTDELNNVLAETVHSAIVNYAAVVDIMLPENIILQANEDYGVTVNTVNTYHLNKKFLTEQEENNVKFNLFDSVNDKLSFQTSKSFFSNKHCLVKNQHGFILQLIYSL